MGRRKTVKRKKGGGAAVLGFNLLRFELEGPRRAMPGHDMATIGGENNGKYF